MSGEIRRGYGAIGEDGRVDDGGRLHGISHLVCCGCLVVQSQMAGHPRVKQTSRLFRKRCVCSKDHLMKPWTIPMAPQNLSLTTQFPTRIPCPVDSIGPVCQPIRFSGGRWWPPATARPVQVGEASDGHWDTGEKKTRRRESGLRGRRREGDGGAASLGASIFGQGTWESVRR